MKYCGEYTKEISFPLGGIGTGCIGLGGDGRLNDWEIFNRPAKGERNRYTHFAVRAIQDGKIIPAVLNGDMQKDFMGRYRKKNFTGFGFGPEDSTMCGFPHFKNVVFNGEFPIAALDFSDSGFPGDITMTAFNPFIPRDSYNSGLPAAFFEIELKNTTEADIKYQVAFSVQNPYAWSRNSSYRKDGCTGITLCNAAEDAKETERGDLTFATDSETAYTQTYWYRGRWKDGVVSYWNDFSKALDFKERFYDTDGKYDIATLLAEVDVRPNQKKKVRFVLTWNIPYTYNYWSAEDTLEIRKPWKNYYATCFESSEKTALYAIENWNSLYERTFKFKQALHTSTLPKAVIDAAASNLAVLKSPTVLRLEDGSFYGWEGVHETAGSCEGTCQHVWNYAYAMCFLFPDLERSVRDSEFKYSTDDDGRMAFRMMLPIGREMMGFRACLDGQMGAVLKCYREWKISGDNLWLSQNWEMIKKVLEYAWSDANPDQWDRDKDGVLEGRQHHTLDMELFGPSAWLEGMYLAALKAATEMAEFLGDTEKAAEYKDLFEKGYEWSKEHLFNGEYFVQKIDLCDKSLTDLFDASEVYWNDETGEIKYQIGQGSSIDQLLGQWHADILGLGYVFDKEQISTALTNMMKNNFKSSMRDFTNPWRIFSLNDEAGSVICAYPDDVEKPKIPIAYCEETMTGFEYSFAGLLCSQGRIDDGIKVAGAVRNRFDGAKRNPWNEFECGSNYARSMASYALVPILSGFSFDMPHKRIGFYPYKDGDFKSVWSLADAWGEFKLNSKKAVITVFEGKIALQAIELAFCDTVSEVKADGKAVPFGFENGVLRFDECEISNSVEIEF